MISTIGWNKPKPKSVREGGNNYSTFKTIMTVIDNPFWLSKLDACSRGHLPDGFTWVCKERRLIYEDETTTTDYIITRDKYQAADEIVDIFQNHGVTPPELYEFSRKIGNFKDIRGHNNMNIMITIYIKNQVRRHELDRRQERQLHLLIARLILNGLINANSVEIKNGIIHKITCIKFDGEKYRRVR